MDKEAILGHVDHTLLKPIADWQQIEVLCQEAILNHTASVCIPPAYVKRVRSAFPTLIICTVIGFPLGYATTSTKVFETRDAVENGADEIDMVVNLGAVKDGDFQAVTQEIEAVKKACGDKLLKVIIETCYLTQKEKITLCACVTEAKADYIKTSTGFGAAGATPQDVVLMKEHIGKNVKIKAAGGIRTANEIKEYLALGCDRIGASAAITALEDGNEC